MSSESQGPEPREQAFVSKFPAFLTAPISPPVRYKKLASRGETPSRSEQSIRPSVASTSAVEAGETVIDDHLTFFADKLTRASRPLSSGHPRLSVEGYKALYSRSLSRNGRHFVVHQHDHPVSGTHYDLRLQINESSSASWAIMYGLPGNPDSRRLNRNAVETRVHCLWNHLVETASHATGSLLIWDTGEYSILPYSENAERASAATDSEPDGESEVPTEGDAQGVSGLAELTEQEKFHRAFQARKIRVRLHGTRLPEGYTITLRRSSQWHGFEKPNTNPRKRRKSNHYGSAHRSSGQGAAKKFNPGTDHHDNKPPREAGRFKDDESIQANNAYTGSSNTIGSIHQRIWYLSMDREASGFERSVRDKQKRWTRRTGEDGRLLGFQPFFVWGRERERSAVTGRSAADVLQDEGVRGYTGRAGWNPVLE